MIKIINRKDNELEISVKGNGNIKFDNTGLTIDNTLVADFEAITGSIYDKLKMYEYNFNDFSYRKNSYNNYIKNLEDYLDYISPLIENLESGNYRIIDTKVAPLNKNGEFFYSYEELVTDLESPCINDSFFTINGLENYDDYNQDIVDNYLHEYNNSSIRKRSIIISNKFYDAFVLDGHHKICASAIKGELAPAIVIVQTDAKCDNLDFKSAKEKEHFKLDNKVYSDVCFKYIDYFDYISCLNAIKEFNLNMDSIIMKKILDDYFNGVVSFDKIFDLYHSTDVLMFRDTLLKLFYNFKNDDVFNFFLDLMDNNDKNNINKIYIDNIAKSYINTYQE